MIIWVAPTPLFIFIISKFAPERSIQKVSYDYSKNKRIQIHTRDF